MPDDIEDRLAALEAAEAQRRADQDLQDEAWDVYATAAGIVLFLIMAGLIAAGIACLVVWL